MASSLKLSNRIISSNFYVRNILLSRILIYNRQFCSKEDETNSQNPNSGESLSKTQEKPSEKSSKQKILRHEKVQFSEESKAAAKVKLMSLLSGIEISSDEPVKSASNLNLARPLKRPSKKERLEKIKEEQSTPEKEMNLAVKEVASNFKEDAEKIEFELIEKLKSLSMSKEALPEENAEIEDPRINDEVSENVMSAVKEVATTISESPIPPRSELTQRLLRLSLDKQITPEQKKSMRSIIETMKFETKSSDSSLRRSDFERSRLTPRPPPVSRIDLFGSKPLNIFKLDAELRTDSSNAFWQKLQEKHLRLLTQFAPANAFEEMIIWTEQGKHWKLPIDNETEMGAEENVGFHEHVFLDHHLKGFPEKGPVRHFMELVVVGLSKSPYITVERKLENIQWFRDYFNEPEKIDILKETCAIE